MLHQFNQGDFGQVNRVCRYVSGQLAFNRVKRLFQCQVLPLLGIIIQVVQFLRVIYVPNVMNRRPTASGGQASVPVIVHCLFDFRAGIHDKWTVLNHRFTQWLAGDQNHAQVFCTGLNIDKATIIPYAGMLTGQRFSADLWTALIRINKCLVPGGHVDPVPDAG